MDPDIRYARNDGVAIAYMVVGDADRDLVFVPDFVSNLVFNWESKGWRDFYERLARSFRLILFDKRGTGISDRGGADFAALETRMEDMRVVLDAVGSERAVVFGSHEGGQMAALYAATYPERTEALVLFQFATHFAGGLSEEDLAMLDRWGTHEFANDLLGASSPGFVASSENRRWFANWVRLGASPEIGKALNVMYGESDVRGVLPALKTPTLVALRGIAERELMEEAAAAIPGARVVRLPGTDNWPVFTSPELVDELEQFVETIGLETGVDSVLATVLFTDLVGSSARAAELGDRRWAELSTRYHDAVRRQLRLFKGTEVDTAGDGFFATFEGPARAIHCARAIAGVLAELDLQVRAGIHTGECALANHKPTGIAVATGARVASLARPGEVLVSSTVKDLVAGSGIQFESRGAHVLKGVPGEWGIYAVR